VSAIALLCLVLLCNPVQLDCSLVALQDNLLFTPVNTCSVYSLEALQTNLQDPFLEPPTTTPLVLPLVGLCNGIFGILITGNPKDSALS
jgi:hypothetical protein